MSLFDKLRHVASVGAHNVARNAQGAYHQVNPFDGGQTFATTQRSAQLEADNRADIANRLKQAKWIGAPGGDQELFVPPRYSGVESTPRIGQSWQPSSSGFVAAPLQRLIPMDLRVGTSGSMQPSAGLGFEDETRPIDLFQPQSFDSGQVSLNGMFLQGALPYDNPYRRLRY